MGDDLKNAYKFYRYCAQDVRTETALEIACPPLSNFELEVWKLDQQINERGVAVNVEAVRACQDIVDALSSQLTDELRYLTNGRVNSASQVAKILRMLGEYGIHVADLTADTVSAVLEDPGHSVHAHPWARRVLEIRQALASASVKKLAAIERHSCSDGRVRGGFMYCGAERTGRWSGTGPQFHNFPRGDAAVFKCTKCSVLQGSHDFDLCFKCGGLIVSAKWNFDAALAALYSFRSGDLVKTQERWGDVLGTMAGALRLLLVAAPGHVLIASDYSAIEAVVLAALAGEEWRLQVFRTHGKIYEMSASKITGVPLEEYLAYKERTGDHHPDRQKIGKVAELASGFQGWVGAWKAFGAGEHMDDATIEANVKRWREESPEVVGFWYGLERAAISAVENPGTPFDYRGIRYHSDGHVLRCILPSGRALMYHMPRVVTVERFGKPKKQILFFGWNSNLKYGAIGWVEQKTYGGRLTENVVQAVARDIMAHGMINAARAGYNIVLHVHDEVVCEQPQGQGSVEELERQMSNLPAWAQGWPVVARGGWRGKHYRKD